MPVRHGLSITVSEKARRLVHSSVDDLLAHTSSKGRAKSLSRNASQTHRMVEETCADLLLSLLSLDEVYRLAHPPKLGFR